MDKRYQVFVSSTFTDLIEERQNVIEALIKLRCLPAGMEFFPGSGSDKWEYIKKVIDDCDYYLLVGVTAPPTQRVSVTPKKNTITPLKKGLNLSYLFMMRPTKFL